MADTLASAVLGLIIKAEASRRMGVTAGRITQLITENKLRTYQGPNGKEMVDEDEVERIKETLCSKAGRPRDLKVIEPVPSTYVHPTAPLAAPPPPPPVQRSRVIAVPNKSISDLTEDDFNLFDTNGNLDMVACRAWGEFEKSRKLNIERLALEGQYVLAAEVGPQFQSAMLTINKGVLAAPSRLKALHPDLSQSVLDSLDKLLREALEKAVKDSTDGN